MIYTIAHTKGGVGKSTLTWNIITALQKEGKDFICIDLDHQRTIYNINQYIREDNKMEVYTADDTTTLSKLLENNSDKTIIIDTGGNGDELNKRAIYAADKIITPIGSDSITEAIGFKKFEAILHELKTPPIYIAFCNIFHGTNKFDDILEVVRSYPKTNILNTVIRTRTNYKKSMGTGLGVVELPKSKNKKQQLSLDKSIKEIGSILKELEIN